MKRQPALHISSRIEPFVLLTEDPGSARCWTRVLLYPRIRPDSWPRYGQSRPERGERTCGDRGARGAAGLAGSRCPVTVPRPTQAWALCPHLAHKAGGRSSKNKSGRQDSNLRPSAPKAPALPSCATPRNGSSAHNEHEGSFPETALMEQHWGLKTGWFNTRMSRNRWLGRDLNSRPWGYESHALTS